MDPPATERRYARPRQIGGTTDGDVRGNGAPPIWPFPDRSSDLARARTKKCRSALLAGGRRSSFWRVVLCPCGFARSPTLHGGAEPATPILSGAGDHSGCAATMPFGVPARQLPTRVTTSRGQGLPRLAYNDCCWSGECQPCAGRSVTEIGWGVGVPGGRPLVMTLVV